MQSTFNDKAISEEQRLQENQHRAQQGQPQIPGEQGRQSIPNKDSAEHDPRSGPGSEGVKPIQDPVL